MMGEHFRSISIVIPVYNEGRTVEELIKRVQKASICKLNKELIVVDDCSKDDTPAILDRLSRKYRNIKLLHHDVNQGKGAAIRTGLKHASSDLIVIQDGDLEYDPHDLSILCAAILRGDASVVFGSRTLNSRGFNVASHYWGNRILSLATSIIYFRKITDMETCYKMMPREIAMSLHLRAKRFDFEPEITAKLLKRGYRILELPINYNCRSFKEGKKITWKDGIKALYYLIKYRFMD